MDLKNLISRIELAASLGVNRRRSPSGSASAFPEPKECLSDRLILYDREEVHRAIERRKATRRRGVVPVRRGDLKPVRNRRDWLVGFSYDGSRPHASSPDRQ